MSQNEYGNIFWLDQKVNNEENTEYQKLLKREFSYFNIKVYIEIEELIKDLMKIEFKDTYIIISGSLYRAFIQKFLENMKDICVIPKFIIFTSSKKLFINNNKDIEHVFLNPYFNYGKIQISFDKVIAIIKKNKLIEKRTISNFNYDLEIRNEIYDMNNINNLKKDFKENIKLVFEYIDCIEKLYLPVYFRTMIKINEKDNFDDFTYYLYYKYKDTNREIDNLLSPIVNLKNIPFELLCKYWVRIYTSDSFYYEMNDYLKTNSKTDKYSLFIKIAYEGVRLKALESPTIKTLYRGTNLQNYEIEKLKEYLRKKKDNLPGAILFSKTFLSFSDSVDIAIQFALHNDYIDIGTMKRVLFKLNSNNHINDLFNTHANIQKVSFYKKEREILFFPFSCFEIIEISEKIINYEEILQIELNYLSRYDSILKNEETLSKINLDNIIKNSIFKEEISKTDFIEKKELKDITISKIVKKKILLLKKLKI